MDILVRIKELRDEHGWSNYRLAKEAGISENSLNNLFRRNNLPTLSTLAAICRGLGISLSQFFVEDDEPVVLNDSQREVLKAWDILTENQKRTLLDFLNTI